MIVGLVPTRQVPEPVIILGSTRSVWGHHRARSKSGSTRARHAPNVKSLQTCTTQFLSTTETKNNDRRRGTTAMRKKAKVAVLRSWTIATIRSCVLYRMFPTILQTAVCGTIAREAGSGEARCGGTTKSMMVGIGDRIGRDGAMIGTPIAIGAAAEIVTVIAIRIAEIDLIAVKEIDLTEIAEIDLTVILGAKIDLTEMIVIIAIVGIDLTGLTEMIAVIAAQLAVTAIVETATAIVETATAIVETATAIVETATAAVWLAVTIGTTEIAIVRIATTVITENVLTETVAETGAVLTETVSGRGTVYNIIIYIVDRRHRFLTISAITSYHVHTYSTRTVPVTVSYRSVALHIIRVHN
jgi:hypothetical protein